MKRSILMAAAVMALTAATAGATSAGAAVIDWTNWTAATTGATNGTATGAAGGVGISYTGEVESLQKGYPSWGPPGTFNGGAVGNAPLAADGDIQLFGAQSNPNGGPLVDTITFSHPVTDPVLAIWSLGQTGDTASFDFPANEPFVIESGGPSNEYNGSTIVTCLTNSVCGTEKAMARSNCWEPSVQSLGPIQPSRTGTGSR